MLSTRDVFIATLSRAEFTFLAAATVQQTPTVHSSLSK